MAYDKQCGSCNYYEFCGDGVKGYCSYYKSYYYPGDSCIHHTDNQCYITTIICSVLGFDDDCCVLQELRSFRNNIMQKDQKYASLLLEYDGIGPDLAFFIDREYKETKESEMWIEIYNFYLCAVANFVKNKQYEEAISRYQKMVNSLKEYFGIPMDYKPKIDNYDYTQGGHEKIKMK